MDLIDLWWNASQESAINELRTSLQTQRTSSATTLAQQLKLITLIQKEQDELRLRLGVLIRLLIEKGELTTEQFSAAIQDAKNKLALAKMQPPKPSGRIRLPKASKIVPPARS
jgi:hypothetical protein